jgi:hypothetical protein
MTFNLTVIKQNKDIEEQTVGVKDKNWISMIPSTKKTYNNNNNNR